MGHIYVLAIKKGQDYMENGKKMYVTAEEAAEMLGVSTGYAYKIIRGLNEELKAKGYRTICGVASSIIRTGSA